MHKLFQTVSLLMLLKWRQRVLHHLFAMNGIRSILPRTVAHQFLHRWKRVVDFRCLSHHQDMVRQLKDLMHHKLFQQNTLIIKQLLGLRLTAEDIIWESCLTKIKLVPATLNLELMQLLDVLNLLESKSL